MKIFLFVTSTESVNSLYSLSEIIVSNARSVALPPTMFLFSSYIALLFNATFNLNIFSITESFGTSFLSPITFSTGTSLPTVRVPVLSVQSNWIFPASGILFVCFASTLCLIITFAFCAVIRLIISGSPSGTAATIIVSAVTAIVRTFFKIPIQPILRYSAIPPIWMMFVTISAATMIAAPIYPNLLICPARSSNWISSDVKFREIVWPFTVLTPTFVTTIFPSPSVTVVPANNEYEST